MLATTEKFEDYKLGPFSLASQSWKDCTGCRDFQPVLDSFTSKNVRLLQMLNFSITSSEDALGTKPVQKGSPSNPYVSIEDYNDQENPVIFQGPLQRTRSENVFHTIHVLETLGRRGSSFGTCLGLPRSD